MKLVFLISKCTIKNCGNNPPDLSDLRPIAPKFLTMCVDPSIFEKTDGGRIGVGWRVH